MSNESGWHIGLALEKGGFGKEARCGRMRVVGEVSEWLKEHAWKACMRETVSGVRIPISPPD